MFHVPVAQPGWDLFLERTAGEWNHRVGTLRAAEHEITDLHRRVRMLETIRADLAHWGERRQNAEREMLEVQRRITAGIEEAVERAQRGSLLGRAKKVDAARTLAEQDMQERHGTALRTARSRHNDARNELTRRQDELLALGRDPLHDDAEGRDRVTELLSPVVAARRRDERARELLLRPWLQRRAQDEDVLRRLQQGNGDPLAGAAAFAEGAMHVVGGRQFALVEVREGDRNLRATGTGPEARLLLRTGNDERPAGLGTGSIGPILRAQQLAAEATGMTPRGIICFTGWGEAPAQLGELVLCGPSTVAAIVRNLPAQHVAESLVDQTARALAELPLATAALPSPAPLQGFDGVRPGDVPVTMPALSAVVAEAHSLVIDLTEPAALSA